LSGFDARQVIKSEALKVSGHLEKSGASAQDKDILAIFSQD